MADVTDKEIEQLEAGLPEQFAAATHAAYERAVKSGARVLIGKDGGIYEIVDGEELRFVQPMVSSNGNPKNGQHAAS